MVWLVPIGSSQNLWVKAKFQNIFDVAFLASHALNGLRCEIVRMLKPDATIFLERPRFIMWFDKENLPAFDKEVEAKAKTAELTSIPLEKDMSETLYRFKISENTNQTNNSNNSNSH